MNKLTQEQKADLLELADHMEIRVADYEFNMGTWGNHCGTVGCLAFHAARLFPDRLRAVAVPDDGTCKIVNCQTGTTNDWAFGDVFGEGTNALCHSVFGLYQDERVRDATNHVLPLTRGQVAAGIRKFVEGN